MRQHTKRDRSRPYVGADRGHTERAAPALQPTEGTGLIRRIKSWHVLLAFVLALLALPGAIAGLRQYFPKHAKAEVSEGGFLEMWYKPKQKSMEFNVPFQISNTGDKEFEVAGAEARFVPLGSPKDPLHFTTRCQNFVEGADVLGEEKAAPSAKPFARFMMTPGERKDVLCSLAFTLNEELGEDLKHNGDRKLVLTLSTKDVTMRQLSFCFSLTEIMPWEVIESPLCEGGNSTP